jgi:hypothetical protein
MNLGTEQHQQQQQRELPVTKQKTGKDLAVELLQRTERRASKNKLYTFQRR